MTQYLKEAAKLVGQLQVGHRCARLTPEEVESRRIAKNYDDWAKDEMSYLNNAARKNAEETERGN